MSLSGTFYGGTDGAEVCLTARQKIKVAFWKIYLDCFALFHALAKATEWNSRARNDSAFKEACR